MSRIYQLMRSQQEYLTGLRRELHQYPELAMGERRTAGVIERELDRIGVRHERIGKTGVLGILSGALEGSGVIALRADVDALPIQEESGVPYRSRNDGVMHACGHDAHTACLLGAAEALARNRDRFGGEARFIFQPGEETGEGAKDFLDAGALKGAERVFGLHCAPDLPLGTIGVRPGLNNAAVDRFAIRVHGKAAHVSTPHLGADALYAASQIVAAMQGLTARRTSPTEPVILSVGRLSAGTAYNIVAEYAELEGTTRTLSQERRMWARERINETARHIAAVSGARAEAEWTGVCPPVINDHRVSQEVQAAVKELREDIRLVTDRPISLGGDNFAEYQLEVPGCYAYLGTSDPEKPDTCAALHSGRFDLDEDALPLGAGLYAEYALWWLTEGRKS